MTPGQGMYADIVKRAIGGAMPDQMGALGGVMPQAMAQGSDGGQAKSDLKNMLSDELKQHQEAYGYANGQGQ